MRVRTVLPSHRQCAVNLLIKADLTRDADGAEILNRISGLIIINYCFLLIIILLFIISN